MSDFLFFFFFSSRRRHTRFDCDWSSDVCSSDLDGFSGSLSGLVLTVLTFLLLRNEQQVGTFNGLLGLIGVAISVGLAAFMRPRYRIPVALVGAAMLVLSTLVLPLYLSATALFAYGVLRAFGGPLHGNALAPIALQVIDRDPRARDRRYE